MRSGDIAGGFLAAVLAAGAATAEIYPQTPPLARGGDGSPVPSAAALEEREELAARVTWRLESLQEPRFAEDPEALAKAVAALRAADAALAAVVSDAHLAADRGRSHSRLRLAMENGTRGRYGYFLALLERYRSTHEGSPPARIEALVGEFAPSLPALTLPDHPVSAVPREIRRFRGKDLGEYLKDSGQWLYVADPNSEHFGLLVIDCSHASAATGVWHDYRF